MSSSRLVPVNWLLLLVLFNFPCFYLSSQAIKLDYLTSVTVKQFIVTDDNRILILSPDGKLYYNHFRSIVHYKFKEKFNYIFTSNDLNFIASDRHIYSINTSKNIVTLKEINTSEKHMKKEMFRFLGDSNYFVEDSFMVSTYDTIKLPSNTNDIYIDHDHIYVSNDTNIKLYDQVSWKTYNILDQNLSNVNQVASNTEMIVYSRSDQLYLFNKESYNLKTYRLVNSIEDILIDNYSNVWILSRGKIFYIKSAKKQSGLIMIDKLFINNRSQNLKDVVELSKEENDINILFDIRESLPIGNKFYYMIDGIHTEWQLLNSNRIHLNLPNGNYDVLTKTNIQNIDDISKLLTLKKRKQEEVTLVYWVLGILSCLLLLVILLFIRNESKLKNLKNKVKYLQTKSALSSSQMKTLQLQLNPHFIFNALNSIQGLIVIGEASKAKSQLRNFSLLMREVLDYSDKEKITIKDDVDFLEKYLLLEQLNHDHKFEFKIDVDTSISTEELIPPMITQIPVENAILHGLKNVKHDGVVHISYKRNGEEIVISVIDNGSGITSKKSNHISKGSNIINKRLKSKDSFILSNIITHGKISGCEAIIRIS